MVSRAYIPLTFFGLPPAAQKPTQNRLVTVVNEFQEIYMQIKPNIDGKKSQVALAHDKRKLSNALVKVQKAKTELNLTKQSISSFELLIQELNQKVENLQSQIETASVEFDKIMADNASKMSQIYALEVKIGNFEIHLDATKIETAGLETQLATIESENENLQQRLNELQVQNDSSHQGSAAQESIDELQNRICQMKLKIGEYEQINENLREDKRVTKARAIDAESQRAVAIAQRNKVIIERYEASIQGHDSSQSTAIFSMQSSVMSHASVAGVNRGTSPSTELSGMREQRVVRGAGSNVSAVNGDLEMCGASPSRRISSSVRSERENMSDTSVMAKKPRVESREVIDLSED